jgi:hypothetical protein
MVYCGRLSPFQPSHWPNEIAIRSGRALDARDSPQRGEVYQVAVAALRQLARVQRARLAQAVL